VLSVTQTLISHKSSIPNLQQYTTSTPKVGKFDITSKDFNRIYDLDICFHVYDDCYVIN
jgi:hypothetical protein